MVLKYQHPFPKIPHYDANDPFGNTSPPWRSPQSPHRGADYNQGIAGIERTPIPAIAAGVVAFSGTAPGLGYMVTLMHPDGMYSGYCHQYAQSPLVEGQAVSRGQSVGGIGGTNGTENPYAFHLHLTMGTDVAGTKGGNSRFDPIPYIDARLNGDDPGTVPIIKESDMPKIISVPGGTIALVTETYGRTYTSLSGGQGFSITANRAAYGEVTGLTNDQVTTLVAEANARGQRIIDAVRAP